MDDKLIKRLMTNIKCSVCGEHYDGENVRILGRYTDLWFVSVHCPNCQNQGLVAAVLKEGESIELVTDLTEDEYMKFGNTATVDADDVLEVHDFLKDFDGDFARVFMEGAG
jgi:transcription elongation factor Elf1